LTTLTAAIAHLNPASAPPTIWERRNTSPTPISSLNIPDRFFDSLLPRAQGPPNDENADEENVEAEAKGEEDAGWEPPRAARARKVYEWDADSTSSESEDFEGKGVVVWAPKADETGEEKWERGETKIEVDGEWEWECVFVPAEDNGEVGKREAKGKAKATAKEVLEKEMLEEEKDDGFNKVDVKGWSLEEQEEERRRVLEQARQQELRWCEEMGRYCTESERLEQPPPPPRSPRTSEKENDGPGPIKAISVLTAPPPRAHPRTTFTLLPLSLPRTGGPFPPSPSPSPPTSPRTIRAVQVHNSGNQSHQLQSRNDAQL
jgi:hypothetical protein